MRIEIVAVGTELLLGQIADTNSAWLGEHLAANGVASHFHQAVGDNHDRITLALRTALARSDGVIMCGGLGPTQDDITREAIAEVMGVPLVRDQAIVDVIAGFFEARGRTMSANNARQADVPQGAAIIPQVAGTAPGLICPVGNKVVYAVPGVPYEMAEMFERGILPDLRARMAESGEEEGVIASRVLRTWGASESGLAESLQDRIDVLDAAGDVTLAFLASGIEGIKVRITARARTLEDVTALLDKEEAEVRRAIEERLGDIVFGVDDESMEVAVAKPAHRPGPDLRRRRVAHRRPHRLPPRQRGRRLVVVPRRRRRLRLAGQVRRPGGAHRAGGHRVGRGGHGRGCRPGDRGRRRPRHHRGGRPRRPGGRGAGHRLRRPPPSRRAGPDPRAAGARRPGARAAVRGHFGP